jgi:hypothetical protein
MQGFHCSHPATNLFLFCHAICSIRSNFPISHRCAWGVPSYAEL